MEATLIMQEAVGSMRDSDRELEDAQRERTSLFRYKNGCALSIDRLQPESAADGKAVHGNRKMLSHVCRRVFSTLNQHMAATAALENQPSPRLRCGGVEQCCTHILR